MNGNAQHLEGVLAGCLSPNNTLRSQAEAALKVGLCNLCDACVHMHA